MEIKDSGNRREFETGAVRDVDDSKGNCTLLPLDEVARLLQSVEINCIQEFKKTSDAVWLYAAIREFNKNHGWSDAESMLELSKHFAEGAKKYKPNNWKLGIPISSYMDSGIRHYLKVLAGWTDENHCRAFIWNMMCAIWTMNNKPELDDFTEKGVSRMSERTEDSLIIGFGNQVKDIPALIVMRNGQKFEIVRAFTGERALKVYKLLTEGVGIDEL